jgi:anaerobic selenocysteine-containing dehydrogenase
MDRPLELAVTKPRSAAARPPRSKATEAVVARTATADRIAKSVCPYCAVSCAQNVYVKEEMVASAGQGWTAWPGRP